MTNGNGGRRAKQTKYPPVLSLSRDALWQSGTGELVDRTPTLRVFRRDPILSWVGLPLTRLRAASPVGVAAPPIADRFHVWSIVAGHGHQNRPDARQSARQRCRRGVYKGLSSLVTTRYVPPLSPSVNRGGRTNVLHGRRSVTGIS